MTIIQTVVLSVIEGVTEFLPISSTGHMVLASTLMKVEESDFVKSFEIIIQLGAILAVLLLYWKKLLLDKKTFINVLSAFIPTAVVGLVLYKYIKDVLLGNPWIVVWSLGIGGILLIVLELYQKKRGSGQKTMGSLTVFQSFLIGSAQSLSIIPGVSRAAATIAGALLLGMKRTDAVEFSFLLAIPTMVAATGLDFVKSAKSFTGSEYVLLAIGFLAAFVTALIVVRWFIGFVKNNTFIPFGVYRILVAAVFVLFVLK